MGLRILGALMVFSPLIYIMEMLSEIEGWWAVLGIFGAAVVTTAIMGGGLFLLFR